MILAIAGAALAVLGIGLVISLVFQHESDEDRRQAEFERWKAQAEWKRDSFHALYESINRAPTYEEWHDFLDNGGTERGN